MSIWPPRMTAPRLVGRARLPPGAVVREREPKSGCAVLGRMEARCAATCGLCDLSGIAPQDLRKCPICQECLCLSMQEGARRARSVCTGCILSNLEGLERIFVHGKDARGRWIDPGTLQGIPTCRHCGAPELGMRCGPVIGCFMTPGTAAPGVRRLSVADFRSTYAR